MVNQIDQSTCRYPECGCVFDYIGCAGGWLDEGGFVYRGGMRERVDHEKLWEACRRTHAWGVTHQDDEYPPLVGQLLVLRLKEIAAWFFLLGTIEPTQHYLYKPTKFNAETMAALLSYEQPPPETFLTLAENGDEIEVDINADAYEFSETMDRMFSEDEAAQEQAKMRVDN